MTLGLILRELTRAITIICVSALHLTNGKGLALHASFYAKSEESQSCQGSTTPLPLIPRISPIRGPRRPKAGFFASLVFVPVGDCLQLI